MALPAQMLAWRLYGAGMDNFGDNDKPCSIPVPHPTDDQILMKVEAIGLCFSDVKLIKAGEQHPRVVVPNLRTQPVIPGHEAVLRVAAVGRNMRDVFSVGQRFIIQAEIYMHGVNLAYGYAIDGGMAQYSVMTDPVLRGDAGCYLLPLSEEVPAAEAALIEPWTCVIAAYRIPTRTTLKAGGLLRVVGDGTPARLAFGALFNGVNRPARIVTTNLSGPALSAVEQFAKQYNIACSAQPACDEQADDLIISGAHSRSAIEALATQLTKGAVCCFAGSGFELPSLTFDIGRIHYNAWRFVGSPTGDVAAAYQRNARCLLKPGGTAWFPGGAGAMGQMHVQLAVHNEQPPRKIVVSDMDPARLQKLSEQMGAAARDCDIEFVCLNPKDFPSQDAFNQRLRAESPAGFDDIIMLVPVANVISDACRLLASDGVMNIFAGIPAGSSGTLDLAGIVAGGHRYVGSSGSSIEDLQYTLEQTETGKLAPVHALAAVGGMNALKQGVIGVMNAQYAGKTVIYPQARDLPLTPVEELEKTCPGINALMKNGRILTKAAEDRLRAAWERSD